VAAGHREIVLTGIFLGAYGHATALHRRRQLAASQNPPLAAIVKLLCTQVDGLNRLRLSSVEPADVTDDLISVLREHPQVVPHFHVPLQSGSDSILRQMNRQYTRDDFLRMIDRLCAAFDRPALTTDIIVGFPSESDARFDETLEIVDRVRFIHTHAFGFSPRPGTAAARWTKKFVRGPIVNERINLLRARCQAHSLAYRQQFLGDTVDVLVEIPNADDDEITTDLDSTYLHGRTPRYFPVHFQAHPSLIGHAVRVRIDDVTPCHTFGTLLE
jgi:threonylcarbamoyladenosine tRNA methylthiotransferase MtaB